MPVDSHLPLLKRAGTVLLVVGIVDIGVMIYCIASGTSYSSSFNIFAVVAGVLLLRGSLKTAAVVRWFSLFMLSAFVSTALVFPAVQPLGLTYTELKLAPVAFAVGLLLFGAVLALLVWLQRQLGSPPVRTALVASGAKLRSPWVPVAIGIGLALVLAAVSTWIQRTDSAARAVLEAKAKLGPSYQFHVSSLNYESTSAGVSVSGVVTAWNELEVKDVPFSWHD
jgi:hypothetical protein